VKDLLAWRLQKRVAFGKAQAEEWIHTAYKMLLRQLHSRHLIYIINDWLITQVWLAVHKVYNLHWMVVGSDLGRSPKVVTSLIPHLDHYPSLL